MSASPSTSPAVQTIERTSKRWKALEALSVLALMLAVVLVFNTEDDGWTALGGILAGLGMVAYVYARIGAWWENG